MENAAGEPLPLLPQARSGALAISDEKVETIYLAGGKTALLRTLGCWPAAGARRTGAARRGCKALLASACQPRSRKRSRGIPENHDCTTALNLRAK